MEAKTLRVEQKRDGRDGPRPDSKSQPVDEPYVRRLDHPYFEMRTPDAQACSYLEGNALKMITAQQEKLRRFLAEARLIVDQSVMPRKRSIHYQAQSEQYKNLRPLDGIPPSELQAFEEAAKDFYDKAAPECKETHPYEMFLRLNFRLPDPDKEPDAYLVYGEDFERRLLILWGCEKQKDSALPLVRHEVIHLRAGEESVADRLRRRLIGWEQMQKDVLLLLTKTREPLLRFIGQPVLDDDGKVKGFKIGEVAMPIEKTRPLRYLLPPEMKQFYKACQEFYQRSTAAASLYERELRTSFQLPDPDQKPEAFRVYGSIQRPRLIVVHDPAARRDQTLWLTPAPQLNIPPVPPATPEQEILGQKPVPPPTLTDKLQRKTIPFTRIVSVAGGILATPLVLALLVWLMLDKSPPAFYRVEQQRVVPGNDGTSLLVRFNKAIDAASVPSKSPRAAFVVAEGSRDIAVLDATLNTSGPFKNREIKLVTTNQFVDGGTYQLTVKGLKDRKLLHNEMRTPASIKFDYLDDKPPIIGEPSSDGEDYTRLLVPFSKPLDPSSVHDPKSYALDNSNAAVREAVLDDDHRTVVLTFFQPFKPGSEHDLVVNNVRDAGRRPNVIPTNSAVHFRFVDTMPPKLRKVNAPEQAKVLLEFNERLDSASATNLANYALMRKDKDSPAGAQPVGIYVAQLMDPKTVALLTDPLHQGVQYDVSVEKVGDMAAPPNLITNKVHKTFMLDGGENNNQPKIELLSHQPDRAKVLVDFGKANRLRPNITLSPYSFTLKLLVNGYERDFTTSIVSISDRVVADYPPGLERVSLVLSSPLEKGQTYKVSVKNLVDVWGHTNAFSEQTLPVKGFYIDLEQRSVQFVTPDRKTIRLALNWPIDASSIHPDNFKVEGHRVVDAHRGENDYAIILSLDSPVTSDPFAVSCGILRWAESRLESPPKEFFGPDRQR